MKHVKILSYKVTTLHFMYDIYIYIYIFVIFFSKTYLTKSVRNVEIAFLYIMKHVKILSYKVTTLHFMHDICI
jgi:hypothetical protein